MVLSPSFSQIIRNNFTSIYRFFLIILGDVEIAKQLTYRVFLNIYRTGRVDDQKLTLFQNAHEFIADKDSQISLKISATELEELGLKDALINKDFIARIFNSVTNLKPEYIEISILKFVEGFTEIEISQIIKKPQIEVSSITSEILHYVKSILDEGKEDDMKVSVNDISTNISKIQKFKNFSPDIQYTDEVITALSKENVEFDKAIKVSQGEKELSKDKIEKIGARLSIRMIVIGIIILVILAFVVFLLLR